MSHNVHIHDAQTLILRELLFRPEASFADLQKPTGLSSDHFSFHANKLIELGYITKKTRGIYALTPAGKEHANKLDTDDNTVERQPKVAVLLAITRNNDGQTEYVMQQRLKHPYFGFWGFPTGKLRWGETILSGAARELLEETGLTAKLEYIGLYHEQVILEETGKMMEDKIFHIVSCTDLSGNFLDSFEGGRNEWRTKKSIDAEEKKFDSYEIEMGMMHDEYPRFMERVTTYSEADF